MRFTKPFWTGIADGSITVAFRWWKRPTVVVGRPYRTGGGRVEVMAVDTVDQESITEADARAAGHESLDELVTFLDSARRPDDASYRLYRVRFAVLDEPDPRQILAGDDQLGADDIADIDARLDRYDKAAKLGPWTRKTLLLVAEHPERRAPDLAEMLGRETKPFKLDVRKLKNLGLTESLRIGYRLSPRGRAYVETLDR
jgi:hypothetical protein